MLRQLFPPQIDNHHAGSVLSIWLLVPLAVIKAFQGLNIMAQSRNVLETVDRVPLGSFPEGAVAHLAFLFAVWGLCILLFGLLGILASVRYRAMVPLALLVLLLEQFGRTALASAYLHRPFFPATLSAAALINLGFLTMAVIGFGASLWSPGQKS